MVGYFLVHITITQRVLRLVWLATFFHIKKSALGQVQF